MIFLLLFLLLPFSLDADGDWDDDLFFFESDGIVIVGTVQTSQQMAVVEREEIERRGAADLANLLHETLNLNIVRHGGYGNQAGINLRGFDSKRVSFLIDGIPVNSSLDGKFDINQIDLNSVERIEVIYGGSDSKFNVSGALGGVINIITVNRQKPGLRLAASMSNTSVMPGEYRGRDGQTQSPRWGDLLDTQNYTFFAAYGGGAYSVSANIFANRAQNHFLFTDYVGHVRRKDNNEVWDTGVTASFLTELLDLSKIIVSSNFFYGDRNFPTSGFSGNVGNQQDFSSRQSFLLDMPRAFHDDFSTEFSLSWQFHRRDYVSPANVASRHDQNSLSAINRWNWFSSERLTLRSGIDYRFISLDSTEIGNRSRNDGGVYLTAEFSPNKSFLVIPSTKMVFTSDGTAKMTAVPKLGFLWNVTDSFLLKNNYFRSFKFPDFEELYWSGGGGFGNPDLRPEDGWGADIGAVWQNNFFKLESVFFTQWIRDSIHWFSGSYGIWRPENVGEAVFFGLENKAGFEIPVSIGVIKKITPSFSYNYLLSYLLSYGYTFSSGKRIPYSPEHTIGISLDFIWSSGSFLISGHYESLRFHDTANLAELKPVFLLNASVNQKAGDNLTIFGALRNILNTSYESFYDYPMPGISLTLGIRANLNVTDSWRHGND
jgi:vitamin B12 transporter